MGIQYLQFILISFGNIRKIFVIVGIYVGGISLALLIAQVIPVGCRQGELEVLHLILGNQALEEVKLVGIGAPLVLDLAGANDSLAGLIARFGEGGLPFLSAHRPERGGRGLQYQGCTCGTDQRPVQQLRSCPPDRAKRSPKTCDGGIHHRLWRA